MQQYTLCLQIGAVLLLNPSFSGDPLSPRMWGSTPLPRREEQAQQSLLPGPGVAVQPHGPDHHRDRGQPAHRQTGSERERFPLRASVHIIVARVLYMYLVSWRLRVRIPSKAASLKLHVNLTRQKEAKSVILKKRELIGF